jgi:hypothetical protein
MRTRVAHGDAIVAEQMDVLLARARISVLAAHTHAARHLVEQLRHRYPAGVVLSTYCRRMGLSVSDTEYVALQTRARLSLAHTPIIPLPPRSGRRGRRGEPGVVTRGMTWLRDQVWPLSMPAEREYMRTELARATTSIMAVYVRYALRFVAVVGDRLSPSAAIALFLDRADADPDIRTAVHALALSRLAGHAGALPAGEMAAQLTTANTQPEEDGESIAGNARSAGVTPADSPRAGGRPGPSAPLLARID